MQSFIKIGVGSNATELEEKKRKIIIIIIIIIIINRRNTIRSLPIGMGKTLIKYGW